jgi:thiol-disulfide isomerase/thioredoxin
MKKLILTIVLATLCLFFKADAQSQISDIKPLKIGDTIPEAVWNIPLQVVNHPKGKKTITLNDYRGKLIILDFWATWCSACIVGMSKTDLLQQQFKGSMVAIPITYEQRDKVLPFINQNAYLAPLNILSVISDSNLKAYFPHQLIPHYVWVGTDGIVKAITGPDEMTSANVNRIINDGEGVLKIKQDINLEKPLFLNADLQQSEILHYSILTKGIHNGLPGGTQSRQIGKSTYRRIFTNSSIFTMYSVTAHYLFKDLGETYNPNRLILETKQRDKLDYTGNSSGLATWNNSNLYNYDLIVPLNESKNLYHYLLADLNKYLIFYGRIEKRKVKCLVLTKKSNSIQIKPDHNSEALALHLYARVLNSEKFINFPVINETGITDEIRLSRTKATNLEDLREELEMHNLLLIDSERTINMFVISDKSTVNKKVSEISEPNSNL